MLQRAGVTLRPDGRRGAARRTTAGRRRRSRPIRAGRGAAPPTCAGRPARAPSRSRPGAAAPARRRPGPAPAKNVSPGDCTDSCEPSRPLPSHRSAPRCSSASANTSASRAPAPSSSISAVSDARPACSGRSAPAPLRIISAAETIGATSRWTATTGRPFDSVNRAAGGTSTAGSGPTAGADSIASGVALTRVTVVGEGLHHQAFAGQHARKGVAHRGAASRRDSDRRRARRRPACPARTDSDSAGRRASAGDRGSCRSRRGACCAPAPALRPSGRRTRGARAARRWRR